MAIVRKVNDNKKTLRAILNAVLAIALAEAEGSVRIDIVFDVYKDVSIKNAERQSRSNSVEAIVYKTLFLSQVVQQWDSSKACPVNKDNLIRFIASEWRKENSLCRTTEHVMKSASKSWVIRLSLYQNLSPHKQKQIPTWCCIWPTYPSMISPVQSLPSLMQMWLACVLLTTRNSLCPCSKSVVQKQEWSMLIYSFHRQCIREKCMGSTPWDACNYRMWQSKQFCWERKIVCISISEEECFISRTFCQVWTLLGVQ